MLKRFLIGLNVAIWLAVALLTAWLHQRGLTLLTSILIALCVWGMVHASIVSFGFTASRIWFSKVPGHLDNPMAYPLAYVTELMTSAWAYYYAMVWASDWLSRMRSQDAQHLPVLLIHGYCCNRGVWLRLQDQLVKRGHGVHAINLEPVFGNIRGYAPAIREAINTLSAANGNRPVLIVAHSMGGLAVRSCVKATGMDSIAHVITLGTPHAGTSIARLGLGTNAQQMRRDRTDQRDEISPELLARLTTIMSYQDNIVFPQETALVEGAKKVQLVGCAHLDLCNDDRAWKVIFERALLSSSAQ